MHYCKKCGNEIKENDKFCTVCGTPNTFDDENLYEENDSNDLNENIQAIPIKNKTNKKNKLKIIIPILLILIAGIAGGLVFMKETAIQKEKLKPSIEIVSVDTENYPSIVVSIKTSNYQKSLDAKNFTIKENDTFQKDLKLSGDLEGNNYNISYKTSDETSNGERNIKVACLDGENEEIAEYKYKTPEKVNSNTQTKKSNSNNVVDTYDDNEVLVKQSLDNYEKSYIRMINSKDTYYIKSSIDLSGNLISEFTTLVKSYSEQQINEELLNYKIEDIKKINDSQYEITVYEKYYISYGKEKKSSYTDFRTHYIVNKTNLGFQIYSIKSTDKLGSKVNP